LNLKKQKSEPAKYSFFWFGESQKWVVAKKVVKAQKAVAESRRAKQKARKKPRKPNKKWLSRKLGRQWGRLLIMLVRILKQEHGRSTSFNVGIWDTLRRIVAHVEIMSRHHPFLTIDNKFRV